MADMSPSKPHSSESTESDLPVDLLEILVCPVTRSKLRREANELVGEVGGLRYPIRDGIPILLADEAALPSDVTSMNEFNRKYQDHSSD